MAAMRLKFVTITGTTPFAVAGNQAAAVGRG
jgi:hypothetical protein